MAIVFTPAAIDAQVWTQGRQIDVVTLPVGAGSGEVSYAAEGDLPEGVLFNPDGRTLFGTPEQIGAGTFTFLAEDETGDSGQLDLSWDVLTGRPPLVVPPVGDVSLTLTQAVDVQMPRPQGGSGRYQIGIEPVVYDATRGFGTMWTRLGTALILPEGVTYDSSGNRLTGVAQDTDANRGGVLFEPTLNNAASFASQGGRQWYTGWRGRGSYISGGTGTIDGQTFTLTHLFTYSGNQASEAISSRLGGLRFGMDPDPHIAQPHLIGNNPYIRIVDVDSRQQLGPLFWWTYGNQQTGSRHDMIFPRNVVDDRTAPGHFNLLFERGHNYWVEVTTNPVNELIYAVTDIVTGEQVRQPFRIILTPLPTGAPPTPVLAPGGTSNTQTRARLQFAPVPPGTVAAAERAWVPAGDLPPHQYAPQTGFNPTTPAVDAAPLLTNTAYDLYARYVSPAGVRGAPAKFQVRTEPSRAAALPEQMRGLRALPGDNRAVFRWDRQDGWQEILRFEYRVDGGTERECVATDGSVTQYVIPGLPNGQAAPVQFRAVNDAGEGPWSETVTVTPDGTPRRPTGQSNLTLQVLIDPDGRGFAWLGISTRVVGCRVNYGRQPGSVDVTFGYAEVEVECSDDFISSGGQGVYTAGELRQKLCYINVLVESDAGGVDRWTVFGGWIESAEFRSREARATVVLRIVDRLAQLERAPVVIRAPLPRETIRSRMIRILTAAHNGRGVEFQRDRFDDPEIYCAPLDASAETPYTGNLMPLLQQAAHSAGGRLFVEQGIRLGVGQLSFEARGPLLGLKGTITDDPEGDSLTFPDWVSEAPIIEAGGRPVTAGDPANIYNVAELRRPGTDELTIRRNEASINEPDDGGEGWGERKWPVTDVITDEEGTTALAEHVVRVFAQPKYWAQQVAVPAHFREPRVAAALASASLSDAFRISFLPPRAPNRIVAVQKVDHVRWEFQPMGIDEPYCQALVTYSLLAPELNAYWVASRTGDNALGIETTLSPDLSGDQFIGGHFDWHYTDSDISRAQVSATRYRRLFTQQGWPVYVSEVERDEQEPNPRDGTPTAIAGTMADGTRFYQLQCWSDADNQWIIRGALSSADANPVLDVMQWDVDKWDDGKVWGP